MLFLNIKKWFIVDNRTPSTLEIVLTVIIVGGLSFFSTIGILLLALT